MQIRDLLKSHVTLSFEVFPPKADKPLDPLLLTLEQLYTLTPDYVSCTYGAGGSNKGRNLELVAHIQKRGVCEALSHYTCVGNSVMDVDAALNEYAAVNVDNLLALRGDFPTGTSGTNGDFAHANELIQHIRAHSPHLCLGAACYPEKHLLADTLEADVDNLLKKQDAGASFLVTQLCHSVVEFERFLELIRSRGVTLPVVAGVMPILKKDGLIRMTLSNGCSIPPPLATIIGRYGDDEASFRAAGRELTCRLVESYLALGVNGIHLYTLNRFEDVVNIVYDTGMRQR